MQRAILIVEDEEKLARHVQTYLQHHGYDATWASSGEEALERMEQYRPDLALLDFQLPGMDGLDTLRRMREKDPQMKVVMVTGHGGVQLAVDAMKAGAYDYLGKPLVLSELKILLEKAVGQESMERALSYYRSRQAETSGIDKLLGESLSIRVLKETMRRLIDAEFRLADQDPPAVLVIGETGTGKEVVARALHFDGPRNGQPFVELNCSALPSQLLEAELFGYERGAFTDAKQRKPGLAEAAHGGTLFLDEIGDADLALQAKLLKLLEEKTVRRLGSVRDMKVNVRVIAATNRPLEQMVREGKFRSDLYFRLRIVEMAVPPLRSRGEDALLLARHFLALHGARYGKTTLRFSGEAERMLISYTWPGNVRELRNLIEQTVLLARGDVIEVSQLTLCPGLAPGMERQCNGDGRFCVAFPQEGIDLEEVERDLVRQALERSSWNVTRAAKLLGLTRDTLRYRIEKFQLKGVD